jgi:hypothetical protein
MASRSDTKLRAIPPVASTPHRTGALIPVTLVPHDRLNFPEVVPIMED